MKTFVMMTFLMLALSFMSVTASAQTTYYTGPQGQNLGSSNNYGGNTTYYTGPQGQNLGTSNNYGGSTTYYTGPQGQNAGSASTYGGTTYFNGPAGTYSPMAPLVPIAPLFPQPHYGNSRR